MPFLDYEQAHRTFGEDLRCGLFRRQRSSEDAVQPHGGIDQHGFALLEVLNHSRQKALSAKPMGTPSHCCKAARNRPGFQCFTVRRPP